MKRVVLACAVATMAGLAFWAWFTNVPANARALYETSGDDLAVNAAQLVESGAAQCEREVTGLSGTYPRVVMKRRVRDAFGRAAEVAFDFAQCPSGAVRLHAKRLNVSSTTFGPDREPCPEEMPAR